MDEQHRKPRILATALLAAALALGSTPARAAKDNPSSSCDNTSQNGGNDCYMWTPPVTSTAVVIDGLNTLAGEWPGVPAKTPVGLLTGSHTVQAQHFRDNTTDALFLFITVVDGSFSAEDNMQIYFDPLHDDGPPTAGSNDNVQFKIFRGNDTGSHAPRRITSAGDVQWTPGSGGDYEVKTTPSGWTVEIRLDAAELGAAHLNSLVGFGIVLNDFDSGNSAVWPLNFDSATPFTTWAALKNRLPIDFVLSLDYSGSMNSLDGLSINRWRRTVQAADTFVAVAGLFRQPAYFDDRVGASRYAWSCSDQSLAGNTTAQFPSGTGSGSGALGSFPPSGTNLFSPHGSPDPPGNNCTPIKDGLQFALGQFVASSAATDREKIVVLLSDGFHNTPAAGAAGFSATPAGAFTSDQLLRHKVRTVSMGSDMTAGTELLGRIATAFNSVGTFEAKYNQLNPAQNLLGAYLETLQQPLHVNLVDDGAPATSDGSFLPGTVDRLVFIGGWNVAANAKALTIERDGVAVAGTAIGPDTAVGYSAVAIDHPTSGGTWKFGGAAADRPNIRFVLADLRVYAEFFTEPKIYNTGDSILLQVRLRDQGRPVLDADATVEIAIPGQGLGNFLSTTDEQCERGDPRLPKVIDGKITGAVVGQSRLARGGQLVSAVALPSSQRPVPDPRTGRYALAQVLLEKCKQEDTKNDLPRTELFDDGTHGDVIAGDGVYSLSFATTLEGSYNFRFHIRGKDSDGTEFSRTSLLSQYVQVAPSPGATATSFEPGVVSGGVRTGYAFFLPKDTLGNYLGPGFASRYHVSVNGGTAVGQVVDIGRGVYGQQVVYSADNDPPGVIIESTDPCFHTTIGEDGRPSPGGWSLWCWLWLILLLLFLFIVWRRFRP